MNPIEEIKRRLDLVEVAGEHLELKRSGKNWKARCPFHDDQTPSLVVFPDSQRWCCFGAGCNQAGDLIDLVQRVRKWDFRDTLRYLAERAGVELKPQSEAEQRRWQSRAEREAVFGAAASFFQGQLFQAAGAGGANGKSRLQAGLAYALERGWSRETLLEAGIGCTGKRGGELGRFLQEAGLDPELPAAVALLGKRGGIKPWAEKYQVQAAQAWLEQDCIPGIAENMLVYPHLQRGRVVYLSARNIEQKRHWNPPRELAGAKQPYFNACWWSEEAEEALIVEGQADALTLGQWGIPAVALAGCALPVTAEGSSGKGEAESGEAWLLKAILERAKMRRLAVGLDADAAGETASRQVMEQLQQAGLPANQITLVRWPQKDANDWMKAGAGADEARELIQESPTWMDELIRLAAELPRKRAKTQRAFEALAALSPFEVVEYEEKICKQMGLKQASCNRMLKAARARRGQTTPEDGWGWQAGTEEIPYLVKEGCIYRRGVNQDGEEKLTKLSNFTARIDQELRKDNGQDLELELRIAGEINGDRLPIAQVTAQEYGKMDWVMREWGAEAIIEPGQGRKDQLRGAIQYMSRDFTRKELFAHTGWRVLKTQERVYLSASGALGMSGVEVELDSDLRKYCLPQIELSGQTDPATQAEQTASHTLDPMHESASHTLDPLDPMCESLKFIDLAPLEISTPVWASIWLAPLSELVRTTFVVWLYGRTGTLKSSLAALALNHYGAEFDGFQFPANFSDTPGRLEHKTFLVKDALLVVDDYAPQKSQRDAQEYQRTAQHLIRSVGNQAGRGRLNKEIKGRLSYAPRGLVMATGEDLPETESLLARLFVVELKEDSINLELLSSMQKNRGCYSQAMAGYLGWLKEHWQAYKASIPERWEGYRREAADEGAHLRLPETAASLMIGWEMGLRYAHSIGALPAEDFKVALELGWLALMAGCKEMKQRTFEEKPEELFLNALRDLLAQERIYLRRKGSGPNLGGSDERAEKLGWYDEDRIYLLSEASYARIAKHFREQGLYFPVSKRTLRKSLLESGWLVQGQEKDRLTHNEWLEGQSRRVMVMMRGVLEG